MTPADRAEFLTALAGLDSLVDNITNAATDGGRQLDTPAAQLTAQLGCVAKAINLQTNFLLESQPNPQPPTPNPQPPTPNPQPLGQCMLCPRPATRLAGDWEVCNGCYESISQPDPATDETWAELLADVIGGG